VSKFTKRYERNTDGLEHVNVGFSYTCADCLANYGYRDQYDDDGAIVKTAKEVTQADWEVGKVIEEGSFSWQACDTCGTGLGGDREAAHALRQDTDAADRANWLHLSVCTDCVMFIANGDEPEEEEEEKEEEEDTNDEPEPDDGDSDDADDEPNEEDYFLSDNERSILYLGKRIVGPVSADAEPCPRDAVMRELAEYIRINHYSPDVWSISDHGNAVRISGLDCGCYFTEHDGDAAKCNRNRSKGE
jgi:hypothetical protein